MMEKHFTTASLCNCVKRLTYYVPKKMPPDKGNIPTDNTLFEF